MHNLLAGAPFHDFKKTSAEPIPSGQAVQVRFQLMPTAYTFAKVHMASALQRDRNQASCLPRILFADAALLSLSYVHLPPVERMRYPCHKSVADEVKR